MKNLLSETLTVAAVALAATGCLGPELLPQVRGEIQADRSLASPTDPLQLIVTVSNDGPGVAWAVVACPAFSVLAADGTRVGPSIPCPAAAVAEIPFRLKPGEVHFATGYWDGTGWGGGRLRTDSYVLTPAIRAGTLDGNDVFVEVTPMVVQLVP